jgi:hypothetical protein
MTCGYVVTSEKLFNLYTQQKLVSGPSAKIRDLFMTSHRVQKIIEANRPIRFTWVGNSEWGKWIGYQDYKGVQSIVQPVFDELNLKYGDSVDCVLVDAARAKLSREETAAILADTDVLLCASQAEGTPLRAIAESW